MTIRCWPAAIAGLLLLPSLVQAAIAAPDIPLPNGRYTRWLEVRTLQGNVSREQPPNPPQMAKIGDRLERVGDRLATAPASEAGLALDDGIGFIKIAEDTILRVQEMRIDDKGGRITRLEVPKGTARLQIRRFTNPKSELTIESPAGIAGVRGTEFGVGITPSGRTSVATAQGSVATSAQGVTVLVDEGSYSVVVPGQPPTPPQSLESVNLRLGVQTLELANRNGALAARFIGRIHPVTSLSINGAIVDTDVAGRFDELVPLQSDRRFTAIVRSPVGEAQGYELTVTEEGWSRRFLQP
jgi:hypothetical protein